MKKVMSALTRYSGVIASLALVVAAISSNTTCGFIYHQPKAPANLAKFKR